MASAPNARGDEETFLRVLDEAHEVIERIGVPYMSIGGIASCVWGRARWTHDIDFFVRPEDARTVLDALADAGFAATEEYPHWLYKAFKDDVLVDVIFRSTRDILMDDEMIRRALLLDFRGRTLPIAPPEDVLVMKAIASGEDTPRYWYDALAITANSSELDWDYLLRRARQHGARRVLSLLLYAQSNDQVVPTWAVEELFEAISTDHRSTARPSDREVG
ncbi:MAG TPA: nucleotidyltransferase [Actinomycetota bacterium]|nr:nucleotidyltransferase [Actinomycetota bacterium]